ncbi:50S ribosomal protein L6 [Candidatus Shapirobacteria bacterium CG07_land_8_20_14_0_80_39_18]|uniref:50S ribosomal protein L6 n=1 Tax=Candidatus Shapirobacteria bacterium CG07_land_8_20_14_0_80_39_18 TaxID=1974882 RepID=A0A2M6YQZ7_9BACT|nr:MAG: 50S ribosomal protein L6 [Candidatus Shapirobacteria bacterium CG07_land_8_20_14_0_80_39_18]
MSKIGAKPIILKEGVTVLKNGREILVKGPLGEVKVVIPDGLEVEIKEKQISIKRLKEDKKTKSSHGTIARLITNAVVGTTAGFEKTLEIVGTGFRGEMEGDTLLLSLGFSHPIKLTPPEGIRLTVVENKIKVLGIDKEKVGIVADKIKRFRRPDVYKGKGIRYEGEILRLKPGKMAAKVSSSFGAK